MVKTLAVGTFLDVLATDPGTLHDIPAWCRVHGHRLVETETVEKERGMRELRIRIEVCA
jgi:tRNA 2-thiouridine synthesizing protein A